MKGKNDAYDTLGLDKDASKREIKLAYLKLAKQIHPDVNKDDPNANEKFLEVRNAYDSLMDQNVETTMDRRSRSANKPTTARDFDHIFSELDEIFDSFFHEFKSRDQRRESTNLHRPKTHVDLRKHSGRNRNVKSESIFSSFDTEFSKLIKRFFNDF